MMLLLFFWTSSAVTSALPLENSTSLDHITAGDLLSESCSKNYNTLTCFKVLAAGLLPDLAVPRRLNIWPGMSVIMEGFQAGTLPSSGTLDRYLAKGFQSFLASISLQIKVLDQDITSGLKSFGRTIVNQEQEEVRSRRKRISNAILLGGLLSAGTLLALGMAAISAMAGKALLMSLMSSGMMIMMNKNNRNDGGNGASNYPKTTYEIIHTIPQEDHRYKHWFDEGEGYQIIKAH